MGHPPLAASCLRKQPPWPLKQGSPPPRYGKEFQQHLADYNIHINSRKSRPEDTKELQSELARERASLSSSKFSDDAFEDFQRKNEGTVFSNDVLTAVVPVLCGGPTIPNQQNVLFTELGPITNDGVVKPKPDFLDGARLHELSPKTRRKKIKPNPM